MSKDDLKMFKLFYTSIRKINIMSYICIFFSSTLVSLLNLGFIPSVAVLPTHAFL